jgi:hypothetical protein
MNHALLSHEAESADVSRKSSGLRVNQPGDSFEREADRVADTVSSGGYASSRIPSWSANASGTVQRQAATPGQPGQQPPAPNNYGDALPKIAEAFLRTKMGQDMIAQATQDDPLLKATTDFVKTPAGLAATGAAATGVIATLAATHRPLPAQLPAIPLDSFSSRLAGFKLKLNYQGPVDRPTEAMVTLSFEGKGSDKKSKQTDSERFRAETARMAAEQEKFRAGLQPKTPQVTTPAPSIGPAINKSTTPDTGKKKEELHVQRKALGNVEADASSADVDTALHSGGQPLDHETRHYMESRIGFDFGRVRVHSDDRAASSAKAMGAQAYTVGSDVVFGAGRYAPQTTEGRRLLAHELTHVVQQSSPAQRPHPAIKPAPRGVQRFLEGAKDWLLGKLKSIKGYPLFCVVIGEDLVTGEKVERNATNLLQGVLGLFDGGPALFEKLKKAANAIENAYQWVLAQLRDLNLTTEYFHQLVDRAVDAADPLHPIDSWDRIQVILREPLDKLIELASRLGKAVLDIILQAVLENFPLGKKVYALLKKAGAVISRIAADPIAFANHLLDAIKKGFSNFGEHILTHLGEGLKRWIFDELDLPDVKMPEHFDFGSILKLVLQVLKLTYEQRRPQLVEKLGEQVVYFFETAADVFTRIKKEGFAAVWKMIEEQASNLIDSLIEKARNWVVEQIVKLGLAQLAALATPIGDAIEIIAGIYETIKFFIEKAAKFVDLIDSIVNSFADMADGNIDAAAKKVEDTLANSIPLLLRFLAGLLHLEGIGESLRKLIDTIRKPIDDAIGKVLDFIVAKAMPIWEKGKEAFLGKLAAVKEWWKKSKKFHYGEEEHEVTVEGEGDHPEIFVASNKTSLEHFLSDVKATPTQTKNILALAKQLGWRQGELQKPADDEKGSRTYEKLVDQLAHLKARHDPPSKVMDPKPKHSLGGGTEAEAFLSANRNPGTEPNDTDPPIWNDLGSLRKEKSYVRGHLLSMRLGGLGVWDNMMPITNKVNQRMNSQVENPLKKATVPGSGRYFHYTVKATYADTVLPPLDPKTGVTERSREVAAEERLVKLSWTTKPAKYDDESHTWSEDPSARLLDAEGKDMDARVAEGDFTPPTVK